MTLDTIRETCDKANDAADTAVSDAHILIDAIDLALESLELYIGNWTPPEAPKRPFQQHDAKHIASIVMTLQGLSCRLRRDVKAVDSQLAVISDTIDGLGSEETVSAIR